MAECVEGLEKSASEIKSGDPGFNIRRPVTLLRRRFPVGRRDELVEAIKKEAKVQNINIPDTALGQLTVVTADEAERDMPASLGAARASYFRNRGT